MLSQRSATELFLLPCEMFLFWDRVSLSNPGWPWTHSNRPSGGILCLFGYFGLAGFCSSNLNAILKTESIARCTSYETSAWPGLPEVKAPESRWEVTQKSHGLLSSPISLLLLEVSIGRMSQKQTLPGLLKFLRISLLGTKFPWAPGKRGSLVRDCGG